MADLTCTRCGATFTLDDEVQTRYPGWTPKLCRSCHRGDTSAGATAGGANSRPARKRTNRGRSSSREQNLTLAEVRETFTDGPESGVFTDGSANPNPGPGGWGAVYVVTGEVIAQDHGKDPDTTNNRMELTALLHGIELVADGQSTTLYTDSKLCVDTVNDWAAGWERRGWKRKTGPVENLDLVKPLYLAMKARPELSLAWIKAHDGSLWNEYADSLSTAYSRDEL